MKHARLMLVCLLVLVVMGMAGAWVLMNDDVGVSDRPTLPDRPAKDMSVRK